MNRINWPLIGALVVMSALIIFLYRVDIAVGQEEHHPHDIHEKFYSTWNMPDNRSISCCHNDDCSPAASKFELGKWYAQRDGQWIEIPEKKIERDRDTPDGRSHLCGRRYGPNDFTVFCFIAGSGS